MADTPTASAAIKLWFETGDIPTQQQFADFITSFPNLVDNNQLDNIETGITAHAGGGQGSAYQLTKRFSSIDTVATALDSAKLPAGGTSKVAVVRNSAANAVNIYPTTGAYISKFGINQPMALPQYCIAFFTCTDGTNWAVQVFQEFASAANPALFLAVGASITMQVNQNNNFILDNLNTNATIEAPTGTVGDGQVITLMVRDNGAARTFTWDGAFKNLMANLPTKTSVNRWWSGTFKWNATDGFWYCLSSQVQQINSANKYRYVASVFMSGTGAPTVNVLENDLGVDPVWTHTGTGIVTMTATNKLGTVGYAASGFTDPNGTGIIIQADSSDAPDQIHFTALDTANNPTNSAVFTLQLDVYNS